MKRGYKTAFTLIELSIALLVISILVAGAISVSSSNVQKDKNEITKKRMDAIYKALAIYAMKNYSLPCPSSLVKSNDSANYGEEVGGNGLCTELVENEGVYSSSVQPKIFYGAVPVKTLGLPVEYAEDGFGEKIAYVVSQDYTIAEFPFGINNEGFSFKNDGAVDAINVMPRFVDGVLKSDIMFVLMSAGANKAGAFNANSNLQNDVVATNSYEQKNYITNINAVADPDIADFGIDAAHSTKVVFNYDDPNDNSFDDVLIFKSRKDMLKDFPQLMFLAGCDSGDDGWQEGYGNAYYNAINARTTACSAPFDDRSPIKICGLFGEKWHDRIVCP